MEKKFVLLFAAAVILNACSDTSTKDVSSVQEKKQISHEQAESSAPAGETADLAEQTVCPVMGNAVNKDLYVDYEGQRIYVCCQGCIKSVRENPEKYIEELRKKGQQPEVL
ncbi:MAG: hypothetical protein ACQEQV_06990 [Fibrobacterota bacterium]